jgi:PAS domain S-box-containing protein
MSDRKLRGSNSLNTVSRYGLGVGVGLCAIVLRIWLTPFLGDRNLYHTAWAAVAFSAWYYGLGPSILTTLTTVLGLWFWTDSAHPAWIQDRTQVSGMIGFVVFSGLIIAFGESMRRSRARKEASEQSLRESQARLLQLNQNMQREIEQRTWELDQRTAQTVEQARLIDLANDAIFVRTASGHISYWNQGAERLYGWSRKEAIGRHAQDLIDTVFPVALSEIAKAERWGGELIQHKRDGSPITVASRWTNLRDSEGRFVGWLEINTDITARKRAEDAARTLSGRILSLQDDERRRIARELHDSLGQYLVSAKVNLDLLAQTSIDPQQNVLLSECLDSVNQCLDETRTISHLLHPPLLDEAGFASAARWYIDGFAQRSAFQVEVDFPATLDRMDQDVETALFRVLQEALTNVHRHSGGSAVRIELKVDDHRVRMQVTDNGTGVPPERLSILQEDGAAPGVGLAGMRQRMRELGGSLEIAPALPGTSITVTIPLQRLGLQPPGNEIGASGSAASAA